MDENENEYVSLVRIPRKWFFVFVWTFPILIIGNTLTELFTDWAWKELGETALTRMAVLMTLTVGWFFILSHIWEGIMLGYAKQFRDKIRAEGKAEGKAEGRAEVLRALKEAQRKGTPLEQLLDKLQNSNKDNGNSTSDEK